MNTFDIDGAQPKRLDVVRGKKRQDFFKGDEEMNEFYNSRGRGLLVKSQTDGATQ